MKKIIAAAVMASFIGMSFGAYAAAPAGAPSHHAKSGHIHKTAHKKGGKSHHKPKK